MASRKYRTRSRHMKRYSRRKYSGKGGFIKDLQERAKSHGASIARAAKVTGRLGDIYGKALQLNPREQLKDEQKKLKSEQEKLVEMQKQEQKRSKNANDKIQRQKEVVARTSEKIKAINLKIAAANK